MGQKVNINHSAANYSAAGADIEDHIAALDTSLLRSSVSMGVVPLHIIGKGTGGSKTNTIIIGTTTLAEEFTVNDELYCHLLMPKDVDVTVDATVILAWAPTGAESSKDVTWELKLTSLETGDILTAVTGTITKTDEALPATQFENNPLAFTLAAGTYLGAAISAIHIRIKRLSSTNNPANEPCIHHASFVYTLKTKSLANA